MLRNTLPPAFLIFASTVTTLFVFDWALGLLGFPNTPQRFSHPANYRDIRENIEFTYVFATNTHGLRYREIPAAKGKNTVRVFVSGDSFVEGVGVEQEDSFPSLIESNLTTASKTFSFINGGLAGTGPLDYGELFYKRGLTLDLDALLICVYVNDVANMP